jgi:hypothetical protein
MATMASQHTVRMLLCTCTWIIPLDARFVLLTSCSFQKSLPALVALGGITRVVARWKHNDQHLSFSRWKVFVAKIREIQKKKQEQEELEAKSRGLREQREQDHAAALAKLQRDSEAKTVATVAEAEAEFRQSLLAERDRQTQSKRRQLQGKTHMLCLQRAF